MRTVLAFVAVAGLLAAGLAALQAEPGARPMVERTALRDGTAGAYDMALSGGWHGSPTGGPRFQVDGIGSVADRDGRQVQAMRVLWQGPATTLLPPVDGPSWTVQQAVHWTDGTWVAVQRTGPAGQTWEYPAIPTADCLLADIRAGPLPFDCRLPGLRMGLAAGTVVQEVGLEDHGHAHWLHLAADGPVRIDWWFAQGVPVPMRVEATAPGAPGLEPRSVRLDLAGLLLGDGAAAAPASAIVGHELRWSDRQPWGPDDAGIDHPFPLSTAYSAAHSSAAWTDLRQWMQDHPRAYVFMAEYSERQGDSLHSAWRIHLSDGREGFSFRAAQTHGPLEVLGRDVTFDTLPTSALAAAAPHPDDAPADMPTVESIWHRWRDHAGTAARQGANLWGFQLLADQDGVAEHYAAGLGRSLRWGIEGLESVGLGGTHATQSILVLDGHGKALRYEEQASSAAPSPAPSPPYTPASLPYIPPAWAPAAGAGLFAALVLALLPKAAAALFTRFQPHQLLDHPTRGAVMDAVRAEPGIHFRALCHRLGRNAGQVRHHVRKLVDGRLVVARASPGYTCYFPYDGTSRALLQAGPLTRSDGARNLIGALTASPGACSKDLALAAGLSPATATYHLKRLQQAGLVDARRDGKAMRMHLTPDGQQAAAALT